MSKRAEEAALKAYPEQDMYSAMLDGSNKLKRKVYIEAYEQAEKDTIERVVKWLEENAVDYIHYKGAVGFPGQDDLKISKGMFSDLKIAIEEEK